MTSLPNPKCDWYFDKPSVWLDGFRGLREILLAAGMTEELKWGHPCYSIDGSNVALMHGFKNYFALFFMKGSLMADPEHILIQQTPHVQAGRQIRFTSVEGSVEMKDTVISYVDNAIEVEKSGAKVEFKKTVDFVVCDELVARFAQQPGLKDAFYALTPGRQKGYLLYFGSARQAVTRESRIDKYTDRILDGFGVDDQKHQSIAGVIGSKNAGADERT
jgi:uncharacterized protein YdeI (YjbR/CyaY-like superfamily)